MEWFINTYQHEKYAIRLVSSSNYFYVLYQNSLEKTVGFSEIMRLIFRENNPHCGKYGRVDFFVADFTLAQFWDGFPQNIDLGKMVKTRQIIL